MKYLAFLAVAFLITSCTAVDISYTREDGTQAHGSYISTKDQVAPYFELSKDGESVSLHAGAEQTSGVTKEEVQNALDTLSTVLLAP